MCRAHLQRYFYNDSTKQCEKFIYGGCDGNENNFIHLEDCSNRCSVQSNKRISDNLVEVKNVCNQEKLIGNCRGNFERYFYNNTVNECQKFIYGGCNGNENNFATSNECETKCSAQSDTKSMKNARSFCSLRAETGPCYAMIPRYYYDEKTKTCEEFTYGGCMGNKNNFEDKNKCLKTCGESTVKNMASELDVCSLEKQTGLCRGYNERYFYNSKENECQSFVYGGCGGNENNFETLENCNNACQKKMNAKSSSQNPCVLPGAVTGPCRGKINRFYFNLKTKKCEQFWFGGCLGNENNFETQDQCNAQCPSY